MEQFLNFMYNYWFKVVVAIFLLSTLHSFGTQWFKTQVEWFKNFFEEGDTRKSSSRRAIEVAVVWVFLASYIKVSLVTSTLQDIPWGWGILIAGILGLKTLDAYVKGKGGSVLENGNGNGNGKTVPPQPPKP